MPNIKRKAAIARSYSAFESSYWTSEQQGILYTQAGMVDLRRWPTSRNDDASCMISFIHEGRDYTRWFDGPMPGKSTVVTLAKRLINDVLAGQFEEVS